MTHSIDFKVVFDSLPQACLLLGPDLSLIEANEAGLRLLGKAREAATGHPIRELFADIQIEAADEFAKLLGSSYDQVMLSRHAATISLPKPGMPKHYLANPLSIQPYWQCIHIPILNEQNQISMIATHLIEIDRSAPALEARLFGNAPHEESQRLNQQSAMQQATADNPTYAAANADGDRDALHILFVEDNEDLRDATSQLLEGLGYTVVAVPDAEKAMICLGSERFDALLTDLSLPKMSGADLAREATQQYPAMRVVITSGYGRAMANVRDLDHAVLLPKPYRIAELADALNNVAR